MKSTNTPPWVIVVDTREKIPWFTKPFKVDGELVQPVIVHRALYAGDYSIEGFEKNFTIERKSGTDLVGTLTGRRSRFLRALKKLALYNWSCILIEEEWDTILAECMAYTDTDPTSIDNTIIAWSQRFPTHWIFRHSRAIAEVTAWKAMHRYWLDHAKHKGTE